MPEPELPSRLRPGKQGRKAEARPGVGRKGRRLCVLLRIAPGPGLGGVSGARTRILRRTPPEAAGTQRSPGVSPGLVRTGARGRPASPEAPWPAAIGPGGVTWRRPTQSEGRSGVPFPPEAVIGSGPAAGRGARGRPGLTRGRRAPGPARSRGQVRGREDAQLLSRRRAGVRRQTPAAAVWGAAPARSETGEGRPEAIAGPWIQPRLSAPGRSASWWGLSLGARGPAAPWVGQSGSCSFQPGPELPLRGLSVLVRGDRGAPPATSRPLRPPRPLLPLRAPGSRGRRPRSLQSPGLCDRPALRSPRPV